MIKNLFCVGLVLAMATFAYAQRPENPTNRRQPGGQQPSFGGQQRGFGDQQRGFGGQQPRFGGPSGFHLMTALDADRNGKLSKKEIDNAVAALKRLDKNADGKLSSEEIGWPPQFGGRGPQGGGFRDRGFPGGGGGGPPRGQQRNQGDRFDQERRPTLQPRTPLPQHPRSGDDQPVN